MASRIWSWWFPEIRPIYKVLLSALGVLAAVAVIIVKRDWDAENRAKGEQASAFVRRLGEASKLYVVRAKVVSVESEEQSVTLAHESIPEVLEATQTKFSVESPRLLERIKPGDEVFVALKVTSGHFVLTQLEKRQGRR